MLEADEAILHLRLPSSILHSYHILYIFHIIMLTVLLRRSSPEQKGKKKKWKDAECRNTADIHTQASWILAHTECSHLWFQFEFYLFFSLVFILFLFLLYRPLLLPLFPHSVIQQVLAGPSTNPLTTWYLLPTAAPYLRCVPDFPFSRTAFWGPGPLSYCSVGFTVLTSASLAPYGWEQVCFTCVPSPAHAAGPSQCLLRDEWVSGPWQLQNSVSQAGRALPTLPTSISFYLSCLRDRFCCYALSSGPVLACARSVAHTRGLLGIHRGTLRCSPSLLGWQ